MRNGSIKSFEDLEVWQAAMDVAVSAYAVAATLPSSERFEMSSQIRRAAVSVPSNIAEGQTTGSAGLFVRHLRIALGSTGELKTLFALARRLRLAPEAELAAAEKQLARTGQMLHGLVRSIQRTRLAGVLKVLTLVAAAVVPLVFRVYVFR